MTILSSQFCPLTEARDDAEAALRFPGPDYREVLCWLHQEFLPESYVEIGVHTGESLQLAEPPTDAIDIDPVPNVMCALRAATHICAMTSADFFARNELRRIWLDSNVAFAFIDDQHSFEQSLLDLLNLESYAAPNAVLALHDTVPLSRETSERTRTSQFYTGDGWKTVAFLCRIMPELETRTIPTAPTGLTLVRGLRSEGAPGIREFDALAPP